MATATPSLKLRRDDTALVIVDAQDRLASVMQTDALNRAVKTWVSFIEVAAMLKLPICVSEQYPKGLGRTLPVMREALVKMMPPPLFIEKTEFSLAGTALFNQFLNNGRKQLIVVGMEAHICVFQTVRDLVARGYEVYVPLDGVVSRARHNWRIGLELIRNAGGTVSSMEALMFDLIERAEGDEFRAVSKLIK